MKNCNIIHWSLAIIGVLLLICGVLDKYMHQGLFNVNVPSNFIHLANSFFLFAIASKLLCGCGCGCKDDKCDTDKK